MKGQKLGHNGEVEREVETKRMLISGMMTRTRPQNCVGNQEYLRSQTFTLLCCVLLA